WVHVHHQDRLARVAWLRERIKICEIQACVSVRESKVGAGVMVRHGSSPPPSSAHFPLKVGWRQYVRLRRPNQGLLRSIFQADESAGPRRSGMHFGLFSYAVRFRSEADIA